MFLIGAAVVVVVAAVVVTLVATGGSSKSAYTSASRAGYLKACNAENGHGATRAEQSSFCRCTYSYITTNIPAATMKADLKAGKVPDLSGAVSACSTDLHSGG